MLLPYNFALKNHCFINVPEGVPGISDAALRQTDSPETSEHFFSDATEKENTPIELITCDDTPLESINEVMRIVRAPVSITKLNNEAFSDKIQQVYSLGSGSAIDKMDNWMQEDLAGVIADIGEPEDLLDSSSDAPIIRVLNAVLGEAVRDKVSDVHLEPYDNELRIRFRIDGALLSKHTVNPALAPLLVSRVKVMARLDIAEKRLPQDGRISIKLGTHTIDLRVSTIPSSYGERVVMRILDKAAGQLTLSDIGMSPATLNTYKTALSQPNGIILVTGPTGSGKTTTLYAGLSSVNKVDRNIMTVEDPIEYNLSGISQTQVNTKTSMSFTKALRAILRQDPDIIMIGEIRDAETAAIAVQASLTGHLVLSTLHTNTAIGAISRMRDLEIEPFLLSSSLSCVMAQRLVRKLCSGCKTKKQTTDADVDFLKVTDAEIYQAVGCSKCSSTGYRGRIGVYEIIPIDNHLKSLIYSLESEHSMEQYARTKHPGLNETAIKLVLDGETSIEEVVRITTNSGLETSLPTEIGD